LLRQLPRSPDVIVLRRLIASSEQDNYFSATPHKIDAISWSYMNPHFRYTTAYRFTVAEITILGSVDTSLYAGSCALVA
jgi:hypothetical protein